jgi:hypothetical protein
MPFFWSFLLILLVALLFAALPAWPYSRSWGYFPGGILLAILILYLVLIWFGAVVLWYPWAAA